MLFACNHSAAQLFVSRLITYKQLGPCLIINFGPEAHIRLCDYVFPLCSHRFCVLGHHYIVDRRVTEYIDYPRRHKHKVKISRYEIMPRDVMWGRSTHFTLPTQYFTNTTLSLMENSTTHEDFARALRFWKVNMRCKNESMTINHTRNA